MKNTTLLKENAKVDLANETMGFMFRLVLAVGGVIGLWALAALLVALADHGVMGLAAGYATAIAGG